MTNKINNIGLTMPLSEEFYDIAVKNMEILNEEISGRIEKTQIVSTKEELEGVEEAGYVVDAKVVKEEIDAIYSELSNVGTSINGFINSPTHEVSGQRLLELNGVSIMALRIRITGAVAANATLATLYAKCKMPALTSNGNIDTIYITAAGEIKTTEAIPANTNMGLSFIYITVLK